ncbi:MAG TPA: hypothetical protein VKB54_17275 [Solirubrobacteraceae bacterium]|nr:hypothetical protein [Solirubrobacteraceae bacterium]
MTSVFGPLVSAVHVEDHVLRILERWLPSYLYEVERNAGIPVGTLPPIRSVVRSSEIEKFPEDQLPCLMLASPGLTDPPEADGGGYYAATWQINLGIEIVAAPNRKALELARLYALAVRAATVQQQQDPGLEQPVPVIRVDWRDERYDVLDSIDDRTVCIGRVELAVTVAEVLQWGLGPLDPLIPPQPPGPVAPEWPTAETVITDVQRVGIEEDA